MVIAASKMKCRCVHSTQSLIFFNQETGLTELIQKLATDVILVVHLTTSTEEGEGHGEYLLDVNAFSHKLGAILQGHMLCSGAECLNALQL